MAGKQFVRDDGTPIMVGDTTQFPTTSALRKVLTEGPHILIAHRCFCELVGGLAVRNTGLKATTIDVNGKNPITLWTPWSVSLNNGKVLLASLDNKIVRILAGEFDTVASQDVTTLVIGTQPLTSVVLISPDGINKIKRGPGDQLNINFA
jgi:hypothetical protein